MDNLVRNISFDQRLEQVAITKDSGFSIYEIPKGNVTDIGRFPVGGAEHIALLSDSNIVAVSGDGYPGGYSKSTVVLWDKSNDEPARLLEMKSPVKKLFFTPDVLVVVQDEYISFYNTSNFTCYFEHPNTVKTPDVVSVVQTIHKSLITLPSPDNQSLQICDFHDPHYILGSIPVSPTNISFVSFDRSGDLIAIVTDSGKFIQLWSLAKKVLVATYKRGMFSTEVTCIAFDNLSNYFLMASKRSTIHVFAIPSPSETKIISDARSKYSIDLNKNDYYRCQFDVAGYMITGVTSKGILKKLRLDIEKNTLIEIENTPLDL